MEESPERPARKAKKDIIEGAEPKPVKVKKPKAPPVEGAGDPVEEEVKPAKASRAKSKLRDEAAEEDVEAPVATTGKKKSRKIAEDATTPGGTRK